jgi:choline dehydrogenase
MTITNLEGRRKRAAAGSDMRANTKSFDYIIVGAGAAGCIVANRLSANPDVKVLLIEAGGSDRNFWVRLPVGYFRTIYDPRFSRLFKTEPSDPVNRSMLWPRGRVLGGSSSINGLIFIRGQRADFDDWETLGASGWSFDSVLKSFKSFEKFEGGESYYRGASGEFNVAKLRNKSVACDAWVEAGIQFGLPKNEDFNAESTYGVGEYQLAINDGWRVSSATAFLSGIRARKNLTILLNSNVARVLFEGRTAVGVEWFAGRDKVSARAEREVILSAGAIQSPQILQLSGIGPADLLRNLDIPIVHDAPEVGKNLQDHYQARTIVRLKKPVSFNDDVRKVTKLAKMGASWLFNKSGPLTVGAGQVGGAACTQHAEGSRPDVQFNVMPLSVDKPGDPLHEYSGFTASVWQCRAASRGVLEVQSSDPLDQPRITPQYFAEPIDRRTIVSGVRMLRDIFAQPAFKTLFDEEVLPGAATQSDEAIFDFVKEKGGTVFHCAGTCRMGSDDTAVVDPNLKVRGVANLRVVDASVMPVVTSANTNAPTLMIGEKGAALIANGS